MMKLNPHWLWSSWSRRSPLYILLFLWSNRFHSVTWSQSFTLLLMPWSCMMSCFSGSFGSPLKDSRHIYSPSSGYHGANRELGNLCLAGLLVRNCSVMFDSDQCSSFWASDFHCFWMCFGCIVKVGGDRSPSIPEYIWTCLIREI